MHNRCSREDFLPESLEEMCEVTQKLFEHSRLKVRGRKLYVFQTSIIILKFWVYFVSNYQKGCCCGKIVNVCGREYFRDFSFKLLESDIILLTTQTRNSQKSMQNSKAIEMKNLVRL